MKLESKDTLDIQNGFARHWNIGPVNIQWYVEWPPQDWLAFEAQINIRWFGE